ncbi:hypothetical protein BBF96_13885 [Anoxybacter fermentans]|uniref:Uncharacterized protein n=1 Tax=Anoxybacter fermentans TaxID=1323375 RepID=A0A3S9T1F5_9FIRM|nr:DUF134 domain-containing protein [Anoxybacter fermentans]AZR74381.1 hypothetical protein BBF96_13885 [Anoxybacter fermentans]
MPRCKKKRCCRRLNEEKIFKPISIPLKELEIVELELDEFEAIRLCDLEGKNQIEAGEIMEISRGTVQRLLKSGRKKIVYALLHSYGLKIKDNYQKEEQKK